jgi:hypothetical protein
MCTTFQKPLFLSMFRQNNRKNIVHRRCKAMEKVEKLGQFWNNMENKESSSSWK